MDEPFVKVDLHGLRQEEAMKVIDKALASAGPATYQIQLIHGYNRGTGLRTMIHDWYQYDPQVKRIMPGDNPGITVPVMKALYGLLYRNRNHPDRHLYMRLELRNEVWVLYY